MSSKVVSYSSGFMSRGTVRHTCQPANYHQANSARKGVCQGNPTDVWTGAKICIHNAQKRCNEGESSHSARYADTDREHAAPKVYGLVIPLGQCRVIDGEVFSSRVIGMVAMFGTTMADN